MNQPKKPKQQMKLYMFLGGLVMLFLVFNMVSKPPTEEKTLSYSDFLTSVELPATDLNKITKVHFLDQPNKIRAYRKDGTSFSVDGPPDGRGDLATMLADKKVQVSFEPPNESNWLRGLLISSLPMILLLLLFVFFMRQLQIGGGKAMSFGKSRAKLQNENKSKISFKDVAGVEEAKEELSEIVDFLKDPKKFTALGGRIPKGVLLVGPPGTGKTILAKAISGEAQVPFFSISGSEFVEMFVGVGASRVRDLFDQAKKNAPCIIFIDEIDAVGRQRGAGLGGGHDEREQTLNQLLVEMDGFDTNDGVILIAATNRADVLDPALLRPGRFDRTVYVPKPDVRGRQKILQVHSRRTKLTDEVDLRVIAQGTPGFSGADLENLVNEAALIAARNDCKQVGMEHFEKAKDKVIMGPERRSMIITEEDKKTTAYHEAGHAIVARLTPGSDPVHKVTIIPRGQALGVTIMLPDEDQLNISKDKAEAMIAYAMGGRAAEKIIFGQINTGASNDIQKATDIARKMVCNWGMSDVLGPICLGKTQEEVFLGRDVSSHETYSNKVLETIDSEIRKFIDDGHALAMKVLRENEPMLHAMAKALLVKEVIGRKEVDRIIDGEEIVSEQEYQDYLVRSKERARKLQEERTKRIDADQDQVASTKTDSDNNPNFNAPLPQGT